MVSSPTRGSFPSSKGPGGGKGSRTRSEGFQGAMNLLRGSGSTTLIYPTRSFFGKKKRENPTGKNHHGRVQKKRVSRKKKKNERHRTTLVLIIS